MAVCPVCSFEEEDDSAVACSVCGSDLEVEESSPPEPSEISSEQGKEETETPLMEKYDQIRKESPEETPQKPEVPVSGEDESSESLYYHLIIFSILSIVWNNQLRILFKESRDAQKLNQSILSINKQLLTEYSKKISGGEIQRKAEIELGMKLPQKTKKIEL